MPGPGVTMPLISALFIAGMALTIKAALISPVGVIAIALIGFGCASLARAAEQ